MSSSVKTKLIMNMGPIPVRFFLELNPVAKGRPRHTRTGRTYTPQKTKSAEWTVCFLASSYAPCEPLEGPIELGLEFVMPKPKSYAKKLYGKPHTKKPDLDNLIKLVKDAFTQGGWWVDDSQVYRMSPKPLKRYQNEGEPVGIWVSVFACDRPRRPEQLQQV